MGQKLKVIRKKENGGLVIRLEGIIDEDAQLTDIFDDIDSNLKINLENIDRINSCGIREWVNTMDSISDNVQITLEDCSTCIVRQMNMITNFSGRAKVISFIAPYYCEEHDKEHNIKINVGSMVPATDGTFKAPEIKMADCAEPLIFDDIEDKYFHFLERQIR